MVSFEDGELEIALVTYNRQPFVMEWISQCHNEVVKRNISLSIYDSSTDGKTKSYIETYNKTHPKINYVEVQPETEVGYKPMLAILNSHARYIWVVGDSRYHEFSDLDKKVFPYIKQGLDYIQLGVVANLENDGKIYTDKSEFLRECLISATCIGCSIYKTELFRSLKEDSKKMQECDEKYRHNYGFGWLGYFYESYAERDNKAVFVVVKINGILPKLKKQVWARRFYECWVENLCEVIDSLPDSYESKYYVPRETWKKMKLDSHAYCYRARSSGGLSPAIYIKYKNNGMLQRVTDKINRIHFYAAAPRWQIEIITRVISAGRIGKKIIKKIVRGRRKALT